MTSTSIQDLSPVLSIDTSSNQGSIALYDGRTLATRSWPANRSHTTTLLSEIHHLLEKAEVQISNLGAIGIAIGPGAFTGLRAGFGVAKGFHLATGVPLVGIPTLEAAALPFLTCGTPVVAVIGAGRGRLVWARYVRTQDGLNTLHPLRNGILTELIAELSESGPVHVTGEIEDEQARLIEEGENVSIPLGSLRTRQAAAFAELTWRRWRSGRVDDAESIEPIYLSR